MINIEIPQMTIGELSRHIETGIEPVRRSTHVGNQPARELAIMSLPPGVDVLMVDTIQGNDRYTSPNIIKNRDDSHTLVSRTKASGRVVGSLTAIDPVDGIEKSLPEVHQRALDELELSNRPMTMMKFFRQYPDLLDATVAACSEANQLRRAVREDGKIIDHTPVVSENMTIYGVSGAQSGVLLPLNGMMTLDMLISEQQGSDSTLHLGGADMMQYVQDPERLSQVDELFGRTVSLLGLSHRAHSYRVLDSRGLAVIDEQSQHELLETKRRIDLSEHFHKQTGVSQ
jgi:hypothetical protein